MILKKLATTPPFLKKYFFLGYLQNGNLNIVGSENVKIFLEEQGGVQGGGSHAEGRKS